MKGLLVLPILLPLLTVAACLMAWSHRHWQRTLSAVGAALQVAGSFWLFAKVLGSGPQSLVVGGWPATLGISISVDLASAVLLILTSWIGATIAFDLVLHPHDEKERADSYPLLHALLAGINGAFLAADLFNLFVWFELLLIASFVLMALGAGRPALEGSLKYVAINLVASAAFLCGLGLAYGACGTLNMADLGRRLTEMEAVGFRAMLTLLFVGAFAIKAALVPFAAWLPASYHTASPRWSALFAGLLAKVGIYAILRTGSLVFLPDKGLIADILLGLGAVTILFGGFGALRQNQLRRMLSFVLVGHMGLLALGAAGAISGNNSAGGGTLVYIVHEGLAMATLYLVAGRVEAAQGTTDMRRLAGVGRSTAWLMVPAGLAVIGIPPLGGFVGKVALIQTYGPNWQSGLILLLSLLTLIAFVRAWTLIGMRRPSVEAAPSETRSQSAWLLVGASLFLSLFAAGPFAKVAWEASRQLADHRTAAARLLEVAP